MYTTCFQRDSAKDEAVVFIFIVATVGLLVYAALRPWIERWAEVRLPHRSLIYRSFNVLTRHAVVEGAQELHPDIQHRRGGIVEGSICTYICWKRRIKVRCGSCFSSRLSLALYMPSLLYSAVPMVSPQ